MSLRDALREALDDGKTGKVEVEAGGSSAEVDVVDVDRIGVQVRGVRVRREQAYDVEGVAERWPKELRDLPDRVQPVEVDARLGGASLRSRPDEMRDDSFVEVDVRGSEASVHKLRKKPGGGREAVDWTMTRDQLGRLLDDLAEG
jgi:hypothetical protein